MYLRGGSGQAGNLPQLVEGPLPDKEVRMEWVDGYSVGIEATVQDSVILEATGVQVQNRDYLGEFSESPIGTYKLEASARYFNVDAGVTSIAKFEYSDDLGISWKIFTDKTQAGSKDSFIDGMKLITLGVVTTLRARATIENTIAGVAEKANLSEINMVLTRIL